MGKEWITVLIALVLFSGTASAFSVNPKLNPFNLNSLRLNSFEIVNAVGIENGKKVEKKIVKVTPLTEKFSGERKERIILRQDNLKYKNDLSSKKCRIVGALSDAIAMECDSRTAKSLVRKGMAEEDKIYRVRGLSAAEFLNADKVWSSPPRKKIPHTTSGAGAENNVKIAVIDTGVDPNHSEISETIAGMEVFCSAKTSCRYIHDQTPLDWAGHGTNVIGIITGFGLTEVENEYGFPSPDYAKGVYSGPEIYSLKVCNEDGYCHAWDIANAIEWAVENGMDVINLSLGGGNYPGHCDGEYLADKANQAVEQGIVVVASAGNENSGVSSPACGSKVIAVGAVYHDDIGERGFCLNGTCTQACVDETTNAGRRACFSNYGEALDVMAPGGGVLSTYSCYPLEGNADLTCNGGEYYTWFSGTSMSAPHVSSLAAIILNKNPGLAPEEVKEIIESNTKPKTSTNPHKDIDPIIQSTEKGNNWDEFMGHGIIDVFKAYNAAHFPLPGPEETPEKPVGQPIKIIAS